MLTTVWWVELPACFDIVRFVFSRLWLEIANHVAFILIFLWARIGCNHYHVHLAKAVIFPFNLSNWLTIHSFYTSDHWCEISSEIMISIRCFYSYLIIISASKWVMSVICTLIAYSIRFSCFHCSILMQSFCCLDWECRFHFIWNKIILSCMSPSWILISDHHKVIIIN